MIQFGAVTLLSAFLLFLVQPLVAREILPWFGGAQSVWATCLVFYQTFLLFGYLYAHLGRRLGVRRQAILHAVLLLGSVALLPVTPSLSWKPVGGAAPTWPLLGLLATTVGGPYFLLASTAPMLQDWLGLHRPWRSPYPLYAVSNVGSLLALIAYPTLVEPLLAVSRQGTLWSITYGAFVVACVVLAAAVARSAPSPAMVPVAEATPPLRTDLVVLWVALAACGSGLLLAVTNHITMDVAVVPFLWVLPLVVYLLTYVLAFAGMYRRATWGAILVLGMAAMAILWSYGFALPLAVQLGVSVGALFAGCMVCHGELSRSAPDASHLTSFYLCLAAGGALGGMLVVFAAPALFDDFWELPGLLLLAYALLWWVLRRERGASERARHRWSARDLGLGLVMGVAVLGFVLPTVRRDRGTVAADRNFYGVLRVQDGPQGMLSDERVLRVGRIFHGGQFLDPARAREPTAYFTAGSGVATAIDRHPRRLAGESLDIGVIGLGVGTIAAWGLPGDSIRYYEINPAVEDFARSWFTFLSDSRADVEVVLGDGRLSLERELASGGERRFDVLVIDAFSGDAVPIHLLTRESADLYWRALKDDGVLVFQVTNRHLDLAPVVRGLAAQHGVETVRIAYDPPAGSGSSPSVWILMSRSEPFLAGVRSSGTAPTSDRAILWTDDRSDLLQILR